MFMLFFLPKCTLKAYKLKNTFEQAHLKFLEKNVRQTLFFKKRASKSEFQKAFFKNV